MAIHTINKLKKIHRGEEKDAALKSSVVTVHVNAPASPVVLVSLLLSLNEREIDYGVSLMVIKRFPSSGQWDEWCSGCGGAPSSGIGSVEDGTQMEMGMVE